MFRFCTDGPWLPQFVPEFPEVVKEHLQERASTVAPYVDSLHKGSFVELVSSAVAHSSRTCSMLACGKGASQCLCCVGFECQQASMLVQISSATS